LEAGRGFELLEVDLRVLDFFAVVDGRGGLNGLGGILLRYLKPLREEYEPFLKEWNGVVDEGVPETRHRKARF